MGPSTVHHKAADGVGVHASLEGLSNPHAGLMASHATRFLETDNSTSYYPATVGLFFSGSRDASNRPLSRYEVVESSNVVAVHLTHVPGTDKYLMLERPDCTNRDKGGKIAGQYDLALRNWTRVDSVDSVFCAGHTVTATGQVIVAGGHTAKSGYQDGLKSIRSYDVREDPTNLTVLTHMYSGRWYPSTTLLPDGQLLIMGGTTTPASKKKNVDYEVFNPTNYSKGTTRFPVEETYLKQYVQNYYPFNYVLPTGDVFNFCKRISRVLIAQLGYYRKNSSALVDGIPDWVQAPRRWGDAISQYPFSGTSVMTTLTPPYNTVDVIIFGGAPESNCANNTAIAGRYSYRMTITWTQTSATTAPKYKFTNWTQEDMGLPRLMGDATLLPTGDVVLLNGAQAGCAGDAGKGGAPKATYPNLWAQLYRPDAKQGQRYSLLSASLIPRMYHSTAALTTNGTILVSGCDRCAKILSDASFVVPSGSKCEYRTEVFHPPATMVADAFKPQITSITPKGGATVRARSTAVSVGFDQQLSITWSNITLDVVNVTLVAPSSTTHSFNMNQRVVLLPIVSKAAGAITVKTPPNPYIAPPQYYMLYLVSSTGGTKTYGQAWWVQLKDTTGAGKVLPPM